jgi:hypothetical protein
MNTGNLISSRQLRAARVLAGLTQAELATEAAAPLRSLLALLGRPVPQPSVALDRSLQPSAHVKTGLPHGGSRVEFGQVLLIPLDRDKERSSLDDSPGESTQLDPISDRQLFDLIVSQFPLRLPSSLPPVSGVMAA